MHRLSFISRAAVGCRVGVRHFSGSTSSIGFIGLGNMGGPMVANLLSRHKGEVRVFDVNQEAVNLAVKTEQNLRTRLKTTSSNVIITMLPSSPHVRLVYTGETGLLSVDINNKIFIDSSTIDPNTTRQIAATITKAGGQMVDAPVSGGVGGAQKGTLTFMVGGAKPTFDTVLPLLQYMGKNIVHCGDIGNGQVAKIANNLILGISMIAVSEGMNLGIKLGMEPDKLAQIINTSSGRCWSSDTYNPVPGVIENVPSSRDYEGGFGVDLMKKDLSLALTTAIEAAQSSTSHHSINLPLCALSHQLYALLSSQGFGKKDFSSVYQMISGTIKHK